MICPGCERPKLACLCSNEAVALRELRLAVRALVRTIPQCRRCTTSVPATYLSFGTGHFVCERHALAGDRKLLGPAELLRVVDLLGGGL